MKAGAGGNSSMLAPAPLPLCTLPSGCREVISGPRMRHVPFLPSLARGFPLSGTHLSLHPNPAKFHSPFTSPLSCPFFQGAFPEPLWVHRSHPVCGSPALWPSPESTP